MGLLGTMSWQLARWPPRYFQHAGLLGSMPWQLACLLPRYRQCAVRGAMQKVASGLAGVARHILAIAVSYVVHPKLVKQGFG